MPSAEGSWKSENRHEGAPAETLVGRNFGFLQSALGVRKTRFQNFKCIFEVKKMTSKNKKVATGWRLGV